MEIKICLCVCISRVWLILDCLETFQATSRLYPILYDFVGGKVVCDPSCFFLGNFCGTLPTMIFENVFEPTRSVFAFLLLFGLKISLSSPWEQKL